MKLYFIQTLKLSLLACFSLLFSLACGGGGDGSVLATPDIEGESATGTEAASEKSSVYIGLKDADGDFVSYQVDVLELKLTKADGSQVNALPNKTTVDLVQYAELSEFLTVASIPVGTYTSASMVIDYGQANVQVEVDGVAETASLIDDDGEDLTDEIEVVISFSNADSLTVVKGVAAHLSLDFDLDASNEVDLSGTAPVVTVTPTLSAALNPTNLEDTRVRGMLASVDETNLQVELNIRPFAKAGGNDDFGSITLQLSSSSTAEVDGEARSVTEALAALAAVPTTTLVSAHGDIDLDNQRFTVENLYVGSSVPGGDKDLALGSVLSISGNILTLKGATITRVDGTLTYNETTTITIPDDTTIRERHTASGNSELSDIAVGTRLWVFGEITSGDLVADHVRIGVSSLVGRITTKGSDSLTLNLKSVNHRKSSEFTGITDPYTLTTSLTLSDFAVGDLVKVKGIIDSSGMNATSISDWSHKNRVHISWEKAASTTPLDTLSSTEIKINLTAAVIGDVHHVFRGDGPENIATYNSGVYTISPKTNADTFSILYMHNTTNYDTFADFSTALTSYIDDGKKLRRIIATGKYDEDTSTSSARMIRVKLNK
ncbi:MAG: hypothetical protein HQL32_02125 [Planctomycetes bacterium]|nr:hypothetical protein [Planctomycetota bacterium]